MQISGEAQTKEFHDKQDIEKFVAFAKPTMKEERRIMLSFFNEVSKQIQK